ncbi:hypothetical protein POUND7_005595 [Theobroma cacao]
MKRTRGKEGDEEEKEEEKTKKKMGIVWQTTAHPAHKDDYIFHNGCATYDRATSSSYLMLVNKRWEGKTIVDLFTQEFRGRPNDYSVSAVKCGRIQVDGENIPVSYKVKRCQKISHFVHRQECPVMAWDVPILQNEPDVLTVCKPASVPFWAFSKQSMGWLLCIIEAGLVQKQYVAKVIGVFPECEVYNIV